MLKATNESTLTLFFFLHIISQFFLSSSRLHKYLYIYKLSVELNMFFIFMYSTFVPVPSDALRVGVSMPTGGSGTVQVLLEATG